MAKVLVYSYDPGKRFDDLAAHEQARLVRFLRTWVTQTQDPGAKWATARKYRKIVAWLGAQPPTTQEWKDFAEGGRVLTPAQRVAIKLPREAGPRYAPRRTEAEEIAVEEKRERRWSERDVTRANARMAREIADEAARDKRWDDRDAARAMERGANELAEEADREKRWDARDARVHAARQRREIEGEVAREKRWSARDERASLHKVALEIGRETLRRGRWEAYEAKTKGTPNEKRWLARLKPGSPASWYRVEEAIRIFEEGGWEAMERLDRGCTGKVLTKELERLTSVWTGTVMHGKTYASELTERDMRRVNPTQLAYVAESNKGIRDRLASLGMKVERARPVGDFLKSMTQLGAQARGRRDMFWLTIPGPLPLRVPVPAVSTWAKPRGVVPQRLERHWEPLAKRQRRMREARLLPAEAAFGTKALEKKGAPAKIPVAKAVMQAMPRVIGTAIQTGAIPARSGLAEVYGAYALSQMAKSTLLSAGVGAAAAGPLGIVIGMASLFSGWKRARGARKERRAREAGLRRMAAARFLTGQVGYIPRTAGTRYVRKRKRAYARPFSSLYGSRLGLAAGTRTPLARI